MLDWIKDIVAVASILAIVYGIMMAGWVIEQMIN